MHRYIIAFLFFISIAANVHAQQAKIAVTGNKQTGAFPLVTSNKASTIYFDVNDEHVVRIAAAALQNDLRLISGASARLDSSNVLQPYSIIIGTIGKSKLVDQLINNGKLNVARIKGQWETFGIFVIDQPFSNVKQAVVIAGNDARGTAFGVFELSKLMGVLPFYWWADITPERKTELFVTKGTSIVGPPSVKFRGIFLNDEDWGLQPWAAKTFEPETGDIGPKTYAKIFELLLRLKANLIWPAMHPSTKAFFHYPGNAKVAADYAIVIGSSHAEPMLRNNVGEWNEKTMGHFNYITNKDTVYKYWEDRVKASTHINAMYTMGMRGVHDSKMEGVKDEKEAVPLLERIFADQRDMLTRHRKKDISAIPQVFTAYKEVLDIYDAGLKLPDDITLVWPDDNYGYIQRLNNEKEKVRAGGSGVYYHASYWGRPHDYLWLSSAHPALVREEMMKAFATGANSLWVLNVGDIKPLEYNIEQFLDMAFETTPFLNDRYVKSHLTNWAGNIFGKAHAQEIESVLWRYFQLAFQRKPEFMGWSQMEPTTKTSSTKFNHFFYGDEAQKRIDAYEALEKEVSTLKNKMSAARQDAFYQLVYYPVMGASWMNKKFLYRDKAELYAKQNRLSAHDYAAMSKAAFDSIAAATDFYNTKLAGGKWKSMMSMKPRDLPVFHAPVLPEIVITGSDTWSLAPEGFVRNDSSLMNETSVMKLPAFDNVNRQRYFIDVFLSDKQVVQWQAVPSHNWIRLSQSKGVLSPEAGKNQLRIWVDIDWAKVSKAEALKGRIVFKGNGKELAVQLVARRLNIPTLVNGRRFIENNGFVSMHAANFSKRTSKGIYQWQMINGLGYTGKVLQALPLNSEHDLVLSDTQAIKANSSAAEYDFYTFTAAPAVVSSFTLPTHPINNKHSMRYGVSVDDGPVKIVDFRTFGRSEEWKQNVLSNRAERKIQLPFLNAGKHTLKIFAIDPSVTLDEIRIDLGGLKKAYSVIPETKQQD
ncbi:MAG: glycosyl hydrolase 115 family protein [Chitinophagaceae bacterium]